LFCEFGAFSTLFPGLEVGLPWRQLKEIDIGLTEREQYVHVVRHARGAITLRIRLEDTAREEWRDRRGHYNYQSNDLKQLTNLKVEDGTAYIIADILRLTPTTSLEALYIRFNADRFGRIHLPIEHSGSSPLRCALLRDLTIHSASAVVPADRPEILDILAHLPLLQRLDIASPFVNNNLLSSLVASQDTQPRLLPGLEELRLEAYLNAGSSSPLDDDPEPFGEELLIEIAKSRVPPASFVNSVQSLRKFRLLIRPNLKERTVAAVTGVATAEFQVTLD
jgi:hypothetical protein